MFDKYCNEVTHHQELLQLSKLKDLNNETQIITTPTNVIQLSPAIVSKSNGTLIITLQTSPQISDNVINTKTYESTDDDIIISKLIKDGNAHETNLSTQYEVIEETSEIYTTILPKKQNDYGKKSTTVQMIKHELDDIGADEITVDSDNEDPYNGDENDMDEDAPVMDDLKQEKFKNFPKLIEDSKLLYKGDDLLNLISKFYRLECDQWYVGHFSPLFFHVVSSNRFQFYHIILFYGQFLITRLNFCSDERPLFDGVSDLCQHYVDIHQIKGYVVCCNMKLIKPRAMAFHMAKHIQPDAFKCPECNKMLTCPKILQYHIQNHLPESQRPLACSQCPRRFSYSSALVAHAISHQPESQRAAHICDECGKV